MCTSNDKFAQRDLLGGQLPKQQTAFISLFVAALANPVLFAYFLGTCLTSLALTPRTVAQSLGAGLVEVCNRRKGWPVTL